MQEAEQGKPQDVNHHFLFVFLLFPFNRKLMTEPWYKVATPRKEVRGGHFSNPEEFAIALEQGVAGTASEDYRDPAQFFSRTCWTRALRKHAGMMPRRLSGRTDNTAPVLTLIPQVRRWQNAVADGLSPFRHERRRDGRLLGVVDLVRIERVFQHARWIGRRCIRWSRTRPKGTGGETSAEDNAAFALKGQVLLHSQGGLGRVQDRASTHPEKSGQRPAGLSG